MPVFGPLPRHTDKNAYFWKHRLRGCCSASVHQNVRAAGNVWLSGSFSDRHRQKCLFLDLCLGTGKNASVFGCTVYEGAVVQVHQNVRAAGNFQPAAFLTGTGKNAYFFTFA